MNTPSFFTTRSQPEDPVRQRLTWGLVISLLVNLCLWRAAAAMARHPSHWDLKPVEITRVVIDSKGHKIEKKITPQQIKKKIAVVYPQTKPRFDPPKRRPMPVPHLMSKPDPAPRAHVNVMRTQINRPRQVAQQPNGAHLNVLTAKPENRVSAPADHTALPGGNAEPGRAIDKNQAGNAVTNPTAPVTPPSNPMPPPMPIPDSKPVSPPQPDPPPTHRPTPVPDPTPLPKPKGPTRDAEPEEDSEVKPEIPDELKQGDYKAFVRVKVDIDMDGSAAITLRTSSGNEEIDRRVLEALKRWKWKPALRDGVPFKSVLRFKFEFDVQ